MPGHGRVLHAGPGCHHLAMYTRSAANKHRALSLFQRPRGIPSGFNAGERIKINLPVISIPCGRGVSLSAYQRRHQRVIVPARLRLVDDGAGR